MKLVIFLIIVVAVILHFKDEIHKEVVNELKSLPTAVQEYNSAILGLDYLNANHREADEIVTICKQYQTWRTEDIAKNFAQNCNDAESLSR